jgi:hypothetical protein
MRKIVLGITTLLTLSLTLAVIGIVGYRVVLAANSRPTAAKISYYPADWLTHTTIPNPTQTIPFGLTWKSAGGLAGDCYQISLAETDDSRYTSCGQGSILVKLTPEEYRQYLYYLSHYAPFAYSNEIDMAARTVWLWFGGHGENKATPAEESEIASWVQAVHQRFWQQERQASLVAVVRLSLAARLGITADEITTEYVETVDWPNACLGLFVPGVDCAQVQTAGYQVFLVADNVRYEYRTNLSDVFRLAGSATLTPTPPTVTATPIPQTPQNTPTLSSSPTNSPTQKPSPTATNRPTDTPLPKPSATPTAKPSPSTTESPMATTSPTATPSSTLTPSPTVIPNPTVTASPTLASSPTSTVSPTATADQTITPFSTTTATETPTPEPSPSAIPGARIDQSL